jgi:ribosome biogenesis GTPase / thiamine phosphate phosphatase
MSTPSFRLKAEATYAVAVRLEDLGWDDAFARQFEPWAQKADMRPGRVAIEFNHNYRVITEEGDVEATATGRLKHRAERRSQLPAVGDWVVLRQRPGDDHASIQQILARRGAFSRKVAGNVTDEQVVAANVDVAFLVMALDADFSLRRLERYLLLSRESGASPIILLTKPDQAGDVAARVAEVAGMARDVPIHVLNPKQGEGLEHVSSHLTKGRTAVLLGSSGVGKSTIINRLAGTAVQRTQEVREADSKGRHTTTHRELVMLPDGGLIIDTPGMRELQLWDVAQAVRETFDDIETLAAGCYFTNCRHRGEPRCAVAAAHADGQLAPGRLESYLKLQEEISHLARQQDERAQIDDKRRSKIGSKALKARLKQKGR